MFMKTATCRKVRLLTCHESCEACVLFFCSPSARSCRLSSKFAYSISRSGYSFWLLTGYNNDRVLLPT